MERIYQAWRKYKILTLISFDVKGAFNGVHSDVLVRRLRERRAPEQAVRWISDFCTGRKAKVVVGKYESEVKGMEESGSTDPRGRGLLGINNRTYTSKGYKVYGEGPSSPYR